MARKRRIAEVHVPYATFMSYFFKIKNEWESHHQRQFFQKDAAKELGYSAAWLSKIAGGTTLPTPEQCLIIARYFGQPIEEVLVAAGYPDLEGLHAIIEADTQPNPKEKERVLFILSAAQRPPWKDVDPLNEFKEPAERVLASSGDPWQRGRDYAKWVTLWYNSTYRNTPLLAWKTDEMLAVS